MRSISTNYTFEAVIADIIDNSISVNARIIQKNVWKSGRIEKEKWIANFNNINTLYASLLQLNSNKKCF